MGLRRKFRAVVRSARRAGRSSLQNPLDPVEIGGAVRSSFVETGVMVGSWDNDARDGRHGGAIGIAMSSSSSRRSSTPSPPQLRSAVYRGAPSLRSSLAMPWVTDRTGTNRSISITATSDSISPQPRPQPRAPLNHSRQSWDWADRPRSTWIARSRIPSTPHVTLLASRTVTGSGGFLPRASASTASNSSRKQNRLLCSTCGGLADAPVDKEEAVLCYQQRTASGEAPGEVTSEVPTGQNQNNVKDVPMVSRFARAFQTHPAPHPYEGVMMR